MDWDFRKANTKQLTHCFHAYPAMFIPQVAGRLIDTYGKKASVLLDPYCGTGTSLVEANIRNINAIGSDLNPLARLIASAKTSKIPFEKINLQLQKFRNIKTDNIPPETLNIRNIDFWFNSEVQQRLAAIKSYIDRINNLEVQRFFLVAFSETIRDCSYTRNGEFKLYRMNEAQRAKFHPDVFGVFVAKIERNLVGLQDFSKAVGDAKSYIYSFDSVQGIPHDILSKDSVDIVVTSPPYGDSRTTVAYGQFSRFSNEWLGYKNAARIDRSLMGGMRSKTIIPLGYDILDEAISIIAKKCPKRATEVCGFYRDYRQSIENVASVIRPGGVACYVVGNRRVRGIELPTAGATSFYFQENGFIEEKVIIRNIPKKRLPLRNSPSNISGVTDSTMCLEYIVIMRKTSLGDFPSSQVP